MHVALYAECIYVVLMQRLHSHIVSLRNISHIERSVKSENKILEEEAFICS